MAVVQDTMTENSSAPPTSESREAATEAAMTATDAVQDAVANAVLLGSEVARMADASAATSESGESASTVVPPSTILHAPVESNGVLLQEFV